MANNISIKPVAAAPSLIKDGSIDGTSFKKAERRVKRRLIVSVEALEKSGKTHFSMTAPGPIAYMGLDIGDEGVVDKFITEKEIHAAEYRLEFPYSANRAEYVWKQFTNDYKGALGSEVKSIVLDTAGEAWELLRIAKFGKLTNIMPHQYGPVNSEFREMIRLAYDSDCNLILLHKQKKQYVNDQWNGKYERSGFNDMEFLAQVIVELYKKDSKYYLRVKDCRQNPKIEGQEIENPTFAKLGVLVFPDTTEKDWE